MVRDTTRRGYIKAGATAAGMLALAGCSGGGDDGGGDGGAVELMHAWTGGDGAEAIESLENAFAEEHPDVERDFRAIGGEGNVELDATVASRLRDGNPPSVFAGWPGNNLVQYEGVLGDVEEDVWEQANLKEAHVDEVVEFCRGPDGMSAVPIGSHRMNDLFYSVEVLEQAGVDPDGIDSFDAFLDALDTIETETDAQPYVNGLATWINLQLFAVTMQGTQGVDAYMDFIEGNGDRAAVQATFENMEELLTNYLNPDAAEIGFTEANQSIMADEAGFIHQGNWAAGAYVAEELTFGEDWDRIQFPGTENMYGFHVDSFIYPSDNPTPEASKTFLRFAGSEQAHIAFNQFKGSIPTRETDTSDFSPYLTETIEDFENAEHRPPTLAHGLAVPQATQADLEDVLADSFLDPYNVESATDGFMNAI